MEAKTKLSILMSVYHKENPEYLKAALDSVFDQTLPADEVLLMEDGPLTRELYQIIDQYKQQQPSLVTYAFPENVQLGRALAKGVTLCKNELVARMDTDDIALPNRLELQAAFMMEHPGVAVCGGAIEEFNDEGTIHRVKHMPETQKEILSYVKLRNPLNHMTVMFRKSKVEEIGNYQHFPYLEDYSLWSRMLAKGYELRNLPEVLVKARTSAALCRRRSGWSYFLTFAKLRKLQHQLKLTSGPEYVKSMAGTFVMIMQPGFVKELAYRKLRK